MKCQRCNGEGVITFNKTDKNGYFNDAFFMKECPTCHGTGKISQTNEEWFCNLDTEDKAREISDMTAQGYWSEELVEKWLKEIHE